MENSGDDGEDVKSTCVAKVMEDPAFASLDAVKMDVYIQLCWVICMQVALVPLMESAILPQVCIRN